MYLPNKYTHVYDLIITNAKHRDHKKQPRDGYQTHHIIPRCLGGSNDPSNLVVLSYKEHRVCHRLLINMTTGTAKYKLMYAYKLFNKKYDTSGIPSREIHSYSPEQFVKAVQTRRKRGSYQCGKNNVLASLPVIELVRNRMKNNNPMQSDAQKERMKVNNNSPYCVPIIVDGQLFPSLAEACRYYQTSAYLLKKNYKLAYDSQPCQQPKKLNYPDKFVTPWGVFKTKKDIQSKLLIPEWTLNAIYSNLDAYPTTNGRASKKIDHLDIDSTKTWRENGFSLFDDSCL